MDGIWGAVNKDGLKCENLLACVELPFELSQGGKSIAPYCGNYRRFGQPQPPDGLTGEVGHRLHEEINFVPAHREEPLSPGVAGEPSPTPLPN